ncbi:MAG: hypothetical protein Q8Q95_04600, partial [bacterium]|nr:hypothetical protein [bacterium]
MSLIFTVFSGSVFAKNFVYDVVAPNIGKTFSKTISDMGGIYKNIQTDLLEIGYEIKGISHNFFSGIKKEVIEISDDSFNTALLASRELRYQVSRISNKFQTANRYLSDSFIDTTRVFESALSEASHQLAQISPSPRRSFSEDGPTSFFSFLGNQLKGITQSTVKAIVSVPQKAVELVTRQDRDSSVTLFPQNDKE